MLIIHKTWCGACKSLKGQFAKDNHVAKLSSDFVMVNLEDDEEPSEPEYRPDGGYVPRIFFMNPSGQVDPTVYNSDGNDSYKYFYYDTSHILGAMKRALAKVEAKTEL